MNVEAETDSETIGRSTEGDVFLHTSKASCSVPAEIFEFIVSLDLGYLATDSQINEAEILLKEKEMIEILHFCSTQEAHIETDHEIGGAITWRKMVERRHNLTLQVSATVSSHSRRTFFEISIRIRSEAERRRVS